MSAMRASITDEATVKAAGYTVAAYGDHGYTLIDPEGDYRMIAGYGHVAPTRWEAVAEGLRRIAQG